ncbi:uncharacterized protein YukE [Actinoplanes lutulentus]|uniref:Type VII secretion system (Wss) protein ESAT-6 n=1 Tax=Actinoplanes lutulentus TaxID=1287878 RepID=A0A327ZLL5_9ACTN|nr:WXG100 family type VII secretion target [Actinoplanes lutulentus]MBB2940605.1 uncharacterized protein YukE [Actinoplanes lutulentus]RAK42916.1 type VII secretion system (Wss) protein ESAT-6 [Actinoplanes lutulentus]
MAIDVNAQTTTDLMNAFVTARSENQAAASAVSNATSSLFSGWSGNAAATFGNAISQWQEGLARVQNALGGLQDNMAEFSRSNERTEDDALTDASSWLNTSGPTPPASWT